MGVDDILDGARADLKAEEQRWNERLEREKGRRKRAEAALEERPTAAELEEANERANRLEREVARLLEQEACPCFHYHLGLAARKCSECEPVDAHKLLAQHEIPGFKRRGLRPADCDLSLAVGLG